MAEDDQTRRVDHTWTEFVKATWVQTLRDNETGNTCAHEYVGIAETERASLVTTFIHNSLIHGLTELPT